ncbi:MAG TPA: penicillin-insensitive murein endopeptidase [Candidatus Thermoplasmatota archaeon]|nr:penicillin-insensitive murein endopeptidase [Candidatus Thermoplasmatota archaeon]
MARRALIALCVVALLAAVPAATVAFPGDPTEALNGVGSLAEETTDPLLGEDVHADFASAFFPTQSRGNRGSDVMAIQYLLRHRGYSVSVDGIFGSGTESAVKSFQTNNGLTADGIVGPNTWGKLVVTVQAGSSGDAVRAVQMQLNEKHNYGLSVDGVFGSGTDSAVRNFQSHAGLSADGIVGPTTWKNLIWHYEVPAFGLASLCEYGDTGDAWGTGATIGQLTAAAQAFYGRGYGPVAVGDISLQHGGDISGHASHEVGLDVDTRPIRTDGAQCSYGTSVGQSSYSSSRTQALCNDLRAYASGHVKVIWFNDQNIINSGCSKYLDYHADHLHIRYCERSHPNTSYQC